MAFGQPPSQGTGGNREFLAFRHNALIGDSGELTWGHTVMWDSAASQASVTEALRALKLAHADPRNPTTFQTGLDCNIDGPWLVAAGSTPRPLHFGINYTYLEEDNSALTGRNSRILLGPPGKPYPTNRWNPRSTATTVTQTAYQPQVPGPGQAGIALVYGYCPTIRLYSGNTDVDVVVGTLETQGQAGDKAFMQLRVPIETTVAQTAGANRLVPLSSSGETTNASGASTTEFPRAYCTLGLSMEVARYDPLSTNNSSYGICRGFIRVPGGY